MLETGWSRHWHDPEKYMSRFPGLTIDAAEFLVKKYKISALGIDSPGLDSFEEQENPVNQWIAAQGLMHIENLCNLKLLPSEPFWLFLGALPIDKGSGSPARILALI